MGSSMQQWHSKVERQPASGEQARFTTLLHTPNSARRREVQAYIAGHYAKVYGACVKDFLPLILELGQNGLTLGALGIRPADSGPLFLEQYIDQTVEQYVARELQRPVSRGALIEIGNLVATGKRCSPLLFTLLTDALDRAGYQWMVFTATPQVKKLIQRLNYQPEVLGTADPERLGHKAGQWGSYYCSEPKIMLVDIGRGLEAIRGIPGMQQLLQDHSALCEELAVRLRDYRRVCGGRHEP